MDWEDTKAFEVGIVDEKGKLLVRFNKMSNEQKDQYTLFHRLVFNLKRLIGKTGKASKIASYAAALFLIKEHTFEDEYDIILEHLNSSELAKLMECINIRKIGCYTYFLGEDICSPKTYENIAKSGTSVIVLSSVPVDTILGQDIYECCHRLTNQIVYVPVNLLEDAPANSVAGGGIANRVEPLNKKIARRKKVPVVEVSDEKYYAVVNRKKFNLLDEFDGSIILKSKSGAMVRLNK